MTYFATVFSLICFLLYPYVVARLERRRPTLSSLMNHQRRRWVANAVGRDTPLDAILSGNLMSSVSFFASTTVLLVLAIFAVFGQLPVLHDALMQLQPGLTDLELEIHLIAVLAMFLLAFLAFTLSLRQFNHFCIMLGALKHDGSTTEMELDVMAGLNSLGARNFNQGIRAYYFSISALAWFVSPLLSVGTTLVIIGVLAYREFFSSARELVIKLHKP